MNPLFKFILLLIHCIWNGHYYAYSGESILPDACYDCSYPDKI